MHHTSVSFPSTTRGAGTSDSTDYKAYGYDANGARLTLRRRDASVINYTYDALDRQVLKHFPANSAADVSTSYDLLGRRLTALYANVSSTPGVSWTWDNAGRRTAEVTNGRSMTIVYDAAGNRALTIWPDAQGVAYTFDGDNRFAWVGNGPVGIGFGYDAIGQLGWIGRSGSSTNIGFDSDGHTTQIAHNLATSPVSVTPCHLSPLRSDRRRSGARLTAPRRGKIGSSAEARLFPAPRTSRIRPVAPSTPTIDPGR